MKNTFLNYYHLHEKRVDIGFFLGGFIFDIFTLAEVNDPFSITQQIIYLIISGSILYFEYLLPAGHQPKNTFIKNFWEYRKLIFHFCLGSLISIYSLYFLISSSFFTSLVFVLFLLGLLVANEVKFIQEGQVNIKLSLYVIVLFCFYSMMWPVLIGFVGITPFVLSIITTGLNIYFVYKLIIKKTIDIRDAQKKFLVPSFSVIAIFVIFYILGWIPPVPLSVQNMGIYHHVEKMANTYYLKHQNPWWRFWQTGIKNFWQNQGIVFSFLRKYLHLQVLMMRLFCIGITTIPNLAGKVPIKLKCMFLEAEMKAIEDFLLSKIIPKVNGV